MSCFDSRTNTHLQIFAVEFVEIVDFVVVLIMFQKGDRGNVHPWLAAHDPRGGSQVG